MWIRLLITALPLFAGLLLWNRLPERVPSHWNISGQIDGWSSRMSAVLYLPLFFLGMELLLSFVLKADPKNQNQDRFIYQIGLWIIPVMSVVTMCLTYAAALGCPVNVSAVIMTLVGVLFILLGNQMPKARQNYTIGIRVPWTLNSEQNWNLTHRMAGPLWMIGGVLMILAGFFFTDQTGFWILMAVIVLLSAVPIVYSYLLYRKGI